MKNKTGTLKAPKKRSSKLNAKYIITYIGCIVLFCINGYIAYNINKSEMETIEIVQAIDNIGVSSIIKEENLKPYEMSVYEYNLAKSQEREYLKWEDREEAINLYSKVQVREGGYLYKGDTMDYKPLKNEWISEMMENKVAVKIPYDQSFGNLIVPGDRFKVWVTWKEEIQGVGAVQQEEILSEDLLITDILNPSGYSVYDVYMDLNDLTISERDALLKDESFLSDTVPTSLLCVIGDQEEFERYTKLMGKGGAKFVFGLRSRATEDTVLDLFASMTRTIPKAKMENTLSNNLE